MIPMIDNRVQNQTFVSEAATKIHPFEIISMSQRSHLKFITNILFGRDLRPALYRIGKWKSLFQGKEHIFMNDVRHSVVFFNSK